MSRVWKLRKVSLRAFTASGIRCWKFSKNDKVEVLNLTYKKTRFFWCFSWFLKFQICISQELKYFFWQFFLESFRAMFCCISAVFSDSLFFFSAWHCQISENREKSRFAQILKSYKNSKAHKKIISPVIEKGRRGIVFDLSEVVPWRFLGLCDEFESRHKNIL